MNKLIVVSALLIACGGKDTSNKPPIKTDTTRTLVDTIHPTDTVHTQQHGGYFVSPNGDSTNDGSFNRPWTLQYALTGARGRIQPGDTVWLRDGVYIGNFRTNLSGTLDQPVVLRQYPAGRATIDGTFRLDGHDVILWGFEVKRSNPDDRLPGVEMRGPRQKLINLIIHDGAQQGITFWDEAYDSEIYGCIVYNNGTHENLDHGVYVHNWQGTKLISSNVFFNNLAYGVHVYAGPLDSAQRNVHVNNNIIFNNGTISTQYTAKGNIIIGGQVSDDSMEVLGNLLYFSGGSGINLTLGYGPVANGYVLARGNALWGGIPLKMDEWPSAHVDSNKVLPNSLSTVIVPNRFEAGRAFVAIYNPQRLDSVRIMIPGLARGDMYSVHNVQDLFATIPDRVYTGSALILLGGVQPPEVWGRVSRAPWTGPVFDVFLVTKKE